MSKREISYDIFDEISEQICGTENYLLMRDYISHSNVSTYQHSYEVAKKSYEYVMRHKIKCNIPALIRGALLHDYFLYDWHNNKRFTFHGFKHAKIAYLNASRDYTISKIEKNII